MSGLTAAVTPIGRALHGAAVGLRHELAELQFTGGRGRQCAIAASAVALATIVALLVRVDAVWWAAISAFMSTQASAPASMRRGGLRIAGTAAGAALALLLTPWLVDDELALCLVLLTVSTVGVLGLMVSGHGYAWLLGAVTVDMVLLAALADPLSALEVACNRTAEVTIGTFIAMVVALLLAADAPALPVVPTPGWADLTGAQWPTVQYALRAGIGVMLVPLVWSWLALPSLSQTAVTVAAVMALPALSNDAAADRRKIVERAVHRMLGCLFGGMMGLACLAVSGQALLPWLLMLSVGIWIAAHVQASQRGISYVGTQSAVVFILTLVQGDGPPTSIVPGVERFAGIIGGLLILLVVTLLLSEAKPQRRRRWQAPGWRQ